MKLLTCVLLLLVPVVISAMFTAGFETVTQRSLETRTRRSLETRTQRSLLEKFVEAYEKRLLENKLKRLLAFKRNQDEDELRSFMKSYFGDFCKDNVNPADYLTVDVTLDFGGFKFTGYEQLRAALGTMENDGETCFIENYKITSIEINGDEATVKAADELEEDVDAADKGKTMDFDGSEVKLEDELIDEDASFKLVKNEYGEWRINYGKFVIENVNKS